MKFKLSTILIVTNVLVYAQTPTEEVSSEEPEKIISHTDYKLSFDLQDKCYIYLDNNMFSEALKAINKAIKINNGNADFFLMRARVHDKMKNYNAATNDIQTALDLAPKQSDMYWVAANVLFKMGRFNEAANNYTRAIQYDNENMIELHNAYYNRGSCLLKMKKYQEAVADFNSAIEIEPAFTGAYHNRGVVLKNLRKYNSACNDFKKAQELGSYISGKYIAQVCRN